MADDVKTPEQIAAEAAATAAAKALADRQAIATKAAQDAALAEKAAADAKAKEEADFEAEIASENASTDPALAAKAPTGFVKVKLLRAHWVGEVRYDPPLRINVPLKDANRMIDSGVADRTDALRA